MENAFICDAVRTPFGRFGGVLSALRADDLGALPLRELVERNPSVDWAAVDDVIYGCANQAGEDNRNVARMSLLLAGLPVGVPGCTINRLCASGLEAIALGARAIKSGESSLVLAGGVESMSRAPFVMGKADAPFSRGMKLEDTTIGWRFVNPALKSRYEAHTMPETAENVAEQFEISRARQDAFALRSQRRAFAASSAGRLAAELFPVEVPQRDGGTRLVSTDEQPRPDTSAEKLARLEGVAMPGGTVTAGNSSSINDGAGALLLASERAVQRYGLTPKARVVAAASAGVEPRIMGYGPVPAIGRALERASLALSQIDVIELNEAFAAQALAVLQACSLPDDAEHVNPNGGAIAFGHPLGASGARLVTTALYELERRDARRALCAMCIGVGQGSALILERV
jgi:acetyl-CoA acyltransferase